MEWYRNRHSNFKSSLIPLRNPSLTDNQHQIIPTMCKHRELEMEKSSPLFMELGAEHSSVPISHKLYSCDMDINNLRGSLKLYINTSQISSLTGPISGDWDCIQAQ